MSLSARDWQALSSIEDELAGSDPRLAGLFREFSLKTAGEKMPAAESGRAGRRRRAGWRRGHTRPPRVRGPSWLPSVLVVCLLLICTIVGAVVASHTNTHGACATAMPTQEGCALHTPPPH